MFLREFINLEERPGCNMTEEGRACAVHGLTECPGYKMIETSAQKKLHQQHQEIRKKSGLPNPNYYKELRATFDLPDAERHVAVAALKRKYKIDEAGPFSYGAKKPRKGSVADLAAKKRKEQEKDKQPVEPKDHMVGVARVVKEGEDLSKYSTERLKAYVKKVSGGGVPAFGSGAKLKRVQAELKRREQGVAEGSGITKLNDYNQWLDKVDALGAEKHMQKNRTLIIAQSWDGERVGEFDTRSNQGWVMTQGISEGAGEKLLSKMIPGGASAFNALDAVRRYKSGDKIGAGIAAAGTIPITSIPAAAVDMARDKYYTGSFLPSDEQRDLANLNRQVADMEKQQWTKMPDGSERSPDGRTIRGPITKAPDEITNEGIEQYLEELSRAGYEVITETAQLCPECGGPAFADQLLAEKKDACYSKVKSRYKVWPSAYASGALVRCRKVGAKNWGNKSKK